MKAGFYPRMAVSGMRRNGRLYAPYIATCILMEAMYYILHFLGFSGVMNGMPGGRTAVDMLGMGTYVMALFAAIFLFYTQSTLIRGRKKEFGLYSILGMNRRNIGRILFWETCIIWAVSTTGGLIAGIGLSKLAELGFTKLIAVPTRYSFSISGASVVMTMLVFAVIFVLIYLNSLRQIRFARPTQLIRADKAGEKPPKANWAVGITGLLFLGSGYYIALKIEQPMSAFLWFFVAVILVVIGTYLTLIAGSVILCRLLQKNRKFYYRADHFVSVSSMAYRMKRNGAGLASICLLLTSVLVMMSSTSALYTGSEECLNARYPNEIGAFACKYGYDETLPSQAARMDAILKAAAEEEGADVHNNYTYSEYSISGYFENSCLQVTLNSLTDMAFIDYDKVAQIMFIDVSDYNRVFGHDAEVEPGQALVGTAKKSEIGDVITVGDVSFDVAGRIDESVTEIDPTAGGAASPTIFVIVNDVDEVAQAFTDYRDYNGEPMLAWFWYCRFDTGLDADGQIALASTLSKKLGEELKGKGFSNYYCESHEAERDDFVSTFGGLFFLGILLSMIFLVSCVVIIYYKQVSEGFEDQARFEIMQKVGMTEEDIRKSINSQMLTVFMIPIAVAGLHLLVVLPLVNKLLMLFALFDFPRLLICAAVCFLLCGLFYGVIYKLTSNAYYKIVS
ncbi:putative ABC transport system permease protein [Ruminococcaceae bacterium YRB3002]|nr:putative ABC transport system permease protein [Ruminococcaceae bacterium YRB3002]